MNEIVMPSLQQDCRGDQLSIKRPLCITRRQLQNQSIQDRQGGLDRVPTSVRILVSPNRKTHFSLQTSLLNSTEILTCTVWVCGESRWRTGPRGEAPGFSPVPHYNLPSLILVLFSLKSDESDPFFSLLGGVSIWCCSLFPLLFASLFLSFWLFFSQIWRIWPVFL